jgi:hypothetical protein
MVLKIEDIKKTSFVVLGENRTTMIIKGDKLDFGSRRPGFFLTSVSPRVM